MYDITDEKSFKAVPKWMKELQEKHIQVGFSQFLKKFSNQQPFYMSFHRQTLHEKVMLIRTHVPTTETHYIFLWCYLQTSATLLMLNGEQAVGVTLTPFVKTTDLMRGFLHQARKISTLQNQPRISFKQ
jgi:hypothetical protein